MQVEIITIGDEILIGQIVDTNSAFIGQLLNMNGMSVKQISSVFLMTATLKSINRSEVESQCDFNYRWLGANKGRYYQENISWIF